MTILSRIERLERYIGDRPEFEWIFEYRDQIPDKAYLHLLNLIPRSDNLKKPKIYS